MRCLARHKRGSLRAGFMILIKVVQKRCSAMRGGKEAVLELQENDLSPSLEKSESHVL